MTGKHAGQGTESSERAHRVPSPRMTGGITRESRVVADGYAPRRAGQGGEASFRPAAVHQGEAAKFKHPHGDDSDARGVPAPVAIIATILALVTLAYAIGVFVFFGRFYPQTSIGALDVSFATYEEAAAALEQAESDYEVSVKGQGLDFSIAAKDGGISVDAQEVVRAASEGASPWLWFVEMWGSHDETDSLEATADSAALGEAVKAQVDAFNETAKSAQNANIVYSPDAGAYEIQPEVYGEQVSADAVVEAALKAVATMRESIVLDEGVVVQPTVLSDDERLIAGCDAANAMVACDVTLKASSTGIEVGKIDGGQISQWISFDGSYAPTLDTEALDAWVNELTASLNTVGTQRTYTRPDGKVVTASGGTYGWQVDSATLSAAVKGAIESGQQGDVEVQFSVTGNGYTAPGQDWGAYCDVDLAEQHARYYNAAGELVWSSGIVSGLPNAENATPTGVYYLNSLQTNVSLKGPIDPETKKPEWDSPVSYWMPFVGNLVGLHDADWQPSWVFKDPSAYKSMGSHGCVNLPVGKAGELFDIIQIGDPVIVHW